MVWTKLRLSSETFLRLFSFKRFYLHSSLRSSLMNNLCLCHSQSGAWLGLIRVYAFDSSWWASCSFLSCCQRSGKSRDSVKSNRLPLRLVPLAHCSHIRTTTLHTCRHFEPSNLGQICPEHISLRSVSVCNLVTGDLTSSDGQAYWPTEEIN